MDYKVKIYDKFDDKLFLIWKSLENKCENYIFQNYEWLAYWHQTIGAKNQNIKPVIIILSKKNVPIALFPFGIRKYFGARVLEFLGGDQSDYNSPIIKPEYSSINKIKKILNIIENYLPPHDVRLFNKLPSEINQNNHAIINIWKCRYDYDSYAAILPNKWDVYYNNISPKIRNDSKRQLKRLSKFGTPKFLIASNQEEYDYFIDNMFDQKRQRYKKTGARDILSFNSTQKFYRGLPSQLKDSSAVHLSVLELNNEILATHWGVIYNNRYYFLLPTYADNEWAKYSTGRLLQQRIIEWAIISKLKIFDFTIGNEQYKKIWCNYNMKIYSHIKIISIFGLFFMLNHYLTRFLRKNFFARKLFMKLNKIITR